jgi:hypothetical protein
MKKIIFALLGLLFAASAHAGKAGYIVKFASTSTVVNSIMTDDGSTVTVHGNLTSTNTVTGAGFVGRGPADTSISLYTGAGSTAGIFLTSHFSRGSLSLRNSSGLDTIVMQGQGGLVSFLSLQINGGAIISGLVSGTASLDFGATLAGACDVLTVAVVGAADGDTVTLGVPAALAASDNYQSFNAYVSAADTVAVKRCNLSPAVPLSDPAAAVVRVDVWKH